MERIYHTWDKWECYPSGFYNPKPPRLGMSIDECKDMYAVFLRDTPRFEKALQSILCYWPNSSEHYLSNERMNRIAWLGQAAACFETRISKFFCGGYFKLTEEERAIADETALDALNQWMRKRGESQLTMEEAASKTQADLY